MERRELIDLIFAVSKKPNAFETLEQRLETTSKSELSEIIVECGILPEMFNHDSSEEKLWAKYSDIVLAQSLNHLNIKSMVLRTRGNSADVYGKAPDYTIVGDAKTFRLSRTAKNQKDFKIKALDDWRRQDTYAVLVSPLLQYPTNHSQIYNQAIDKNVTLLSYTHLKLLLDHPLERRLNGLWEVGNRLRGVLTDQQHSHSALYWKEIDKTVCWVANVGSDTLQKYKQHEIENTKSFGEEGIKYWRSIMEGYKKLTKEEAVQKLIKAEKIEAKIKIIERAISRDPSVFLAYE